MATLSLVVGIIGNIISVLMFLSPVKTFCRIVKQRSTGEFESLPYICTLLNSSLWTYYGIIKPNSFLVATINAFGVVVEIVYIVLFLIFAPQKMRAKTGMLVGFLDVGFLVSVLLVTQFTMDIPEMRINVTGFTCAGLNIIMYGSPLAAMKTVVTTKSVEYMPFLISFFFFLNGGVWTLYAILVEDWFLGVPNGIGVVFGTAQLLLYAIYRNARPSTKQMHSVMEEGQQREPLLPPSGQVQEKNEN